MAAKTAKEAQFREALDFYGRALRSGKNADLVTASLAVFCTRRNKRHQAEIARVWREAKRTEKS